MRNLFIGIILLFELLFGGVKPAYSVVLPHNNADVILSIKHNSKNNIYESQNYEHAVLKINNDSEIYTSFIRKTFGSGYDKISIAPCFLNIAVCIFDNNLIAKSHYISLNLKNEIYTRAP